jgi:hypothetical protein
MDYPWKFFYVYFQKKVKKNIYIYIKKNDPLKKNLSCFPPGPKSESVYVLALMIKSNKAYNHN